MDSLECITVSHFADRLSAAVGRCGNPVLVGLDPRWEQLPALLREGIDPGSLQQRSVAYTRFCCGVIDVVAPLVSGVKPQAAFFEELGPAGMQALWDVIAYARKRGLLVVLDGKRNDIGTTAAAYAAAYLGADEASPWGADALTVSPYLGDDSLTPFVDVAKQRGAGIFVLVKTSNPGGKTFQDLMTGDRPLYEHVAALVESQSGQTLGACGYGTVGAVVGATYPEQLRKLRALMPRTWLLVPGFGAQGGSAADVAGAFDERGMGAIVNNSRGIIFAHARPEYRDRFGPSRWQQAVEAATREMVDQLRADTPAGRLGA
ncbi:MAG: orotidine-5'-phosphate decarboxylase [Planctomycetes bacterium]|nr:orotidine-5'-phosphate decarboxylase [Planctomycetota bacterium]